MAHEDANLRVFFKRVQREVLSTRIGTPAKRPDVSFPAIVKKRWPTH